MIFRAVCALGNENYILQFCPLVLLYLLRLRMNDFILSDTYHDQVAHLQLFIIFGWPQDSNSDEDEVRRQWEADKPLSERLKVNLGHCQVFKLTWRVDVASLIFDADKG